MSKSIEHSRTVIQSMITRAAAALGLVCALAWNDAIGGLSIAATLLAVAFLLVLSRASAKVGGEAAISREAEG